MIVCCGEALIDMLPRISKEGAAVYQPFNGGSIFNTAIALGRLGIITGFFSGLSTDFFGESLVAALESQQCGFEIRQDLGQALNPCLCKTGQWPGALFLLR